MILRNANPVYFLIPFLFGLIYFQVFSSDYAYLDEIYQLWHNNDNTNFISSHTQGRWLTGLLVKKLFSSISKIEQLKYLRIFSLVGWVLNTFIWAYFFKKWIGSLGVRNVLWLGVIFFVGAISVCVYIGWASCMEFFLGFTLGLLSSNALFASLMNGDGRIRPLITAILVSLFFGLISLFIYQPAFGIFLIPFFLRYTARKKAIPDRFCVTGLSVYLITYIVYYPLFLYSLKAYRVDASARTQIHFDVLKKISFFFSGPFPQGFSMNLLFYAGSIFSQVLYVLVFLLWLVIIFRQNTPVKVAGKIFFVGFILFLLALMYLPSMIAAENFPSYRTLFVFNLAVFLMVAESLFSLVKSKRSRRVFLTTGIVWLLLTGFYAFNFQFINPLKKEYFVLSDFFRKNYKPPMKEIYFIRADKFLFSSQFHTKVYRDEFGAPSTYRDWVPEPIVKQMIFELTGDRSIAEKTSVIQFENVAAFNLSQRSPADSNHLVIDMNLLFNQGK